MLTDDKLNDFIFKLHEMLLVNPLISDSDCEDEGYDHLYEFVYQQLGHYSSGYICHN